MKVLLTQIFLALLPLLSLYGQENPFTHLKSENIGPTVFGGRVVDVDVNPDNPNEFYVAYASGGLWHTVNNGQSLTPIFDHEAIMSIGDIAVIWEEPRTIIIGSGEVNSSRSSYYGNGMYISSDMGKTWTHHGLDDSQHIGRVLVNPDDRMEIYVAVLGALYTENNERGVFKSIDGGKSWQKSLYINDSTGVVDLIMHPENPEILYAAAWERDRKAWNFKEAGASSGIYKTMDGGNNWELLNTEDSGFPTGEGVGRIGLDVTIDADGNEVLYAILDNYHRRPAEDKKADDGLSKGDFETMTQDQLLALSNDELTGYLQQYGFPEKYTADVVKKMVREDDLKPIALKEYVEDANSLLFDTPVIGAEVYKSMDGGKTWKKTHDNYLESVYNSYGYYFGQIRISPHNPEKVYIMGVPVLKSDDGGKSWENINGDNVHVDHHALWINPELEGHLILGNDGGVNVSYDDGKTWNNVNDPAVGQFYYIYADDAEPYNVYGGTQDNGVWKGPSNYRHGDGWQNSGNYPYKRMMGGDGMQVQVDGEGHTYTGYQFGNYYRLHDSKQGAYITPKHELGDRPYRWNWQSPILLSAHNDRILFMGANKVLRSMDQGDTFTPISPDLTRGGRKGDVAYGTLTSIDESQKEYGKMVVGSDDGLIHTSVDGGKHWDKVWDSSPQEIWVSRVIISTHNDDLIYAAVNNMRHDDFAPYLMKSEDFGKTWQNITGGLPHFSINVIKEDPTHPEILYVGTDHGTYVSHDTGSSFHKLTSAIPNVPVHDIVVKGDDLLIGTHGRSIYKMPLNSLRSYAEHGNNDLYVLPIDNINYNPRWGSGYGIWSAKSEPHVSFTTFSKGSGKGSYEILSDGKSIARHDIDINSGIDTYDLSLLLDKKHIKTLERKLKKDKDAQVKTIKQGEDGLYYLPPGTYDLKVKVGSETTMRTFEIKS